MVTTTLQIVGAALIGVSESKRADGEESPISTESANNILLAGLAIQVSKREGVSWASMPFANKGTNSYFFLAKKQTFLELLFPRILGYFRSHCIPEYEDSNFQT